MEEIRENEKIVYSKENRLALIDNLRGAVIFSTVLVGIVSSFDFIPQFLVHLPESANGIGLADLGVVAFTFILSLMMSYNFRRRVSEKGAKPAVRHYITRGFALIGIGFLFGYLKNAAGMPDAAGAGAEWNILVTYGAGTILMLLFLPIKKAEIRIFIGVGIMVLYQAVFLHIPSLKPFIIANDQGGPVGLVNYLGLMLISSGLGEIYFTDKKKFYSFFAAFAGVGVVFTVLNLTVSGSRKSGFFSYIYMNKIYLSTGYMLTSLAVILVLFVLLDKWKYFREKPLPLLTGFGQSSLLFYTVGGGLTELAFAVIGKPVENGIITGGTAGDFFLGLVVLIVPLITAAILLEKHKIRISI